MIATHNGNCFYCGQSFHEGIHEVRIVPSNHVPGMYEELDTIPDSPATRTAHNNCMILHGPEWAQEAFMICPEGSPNYNPVRV